MNQKEFSNEAMKTDYEIAIDVIRKWSTDNEDSHIDWRRIHAAANIIAIESFASAEESAEAWREMSVAEDQLAAAEARSYALCFLALIHGNAKGPNGEAIPQVSTSQAKDMASKLAALRQEVIDAKNEYTLAKTKYLRLTKQADALIEIEQSGKSTAQRLTKEPY